MAWLCLETKDYKININKLSYELNYFSARAIIKDINLDRFLILYSTFLFRRKKKQACSQQCETNASKYCFKCHLYYCENCFASDKHEHSSSTTNVAGKGVDKPCYVDVEYVSAVEAVVPICDEHKSYSKFLCFACEDQFICLYCKHRLHKGHATGTIKDSVSRLRNWIEISLPKDVMTLDKDHASNAKLLSELAHARNLFVAELSDRKKKCLSEFKQLLEEEESVLIEQFDGKIKQLSKQVVSFCDGIYSQQKNITLFKEFMLNRTNFELLSAKDELINKVDVLNIENASIKITACEVAFAELRPLSENIIQPILKIQGFRDEELEVQQFSNIDALSVIQVTGCKMKLTEPEDSYVFLHLPYYSDHSLSCTMCLSILLFKLFHIICCC